MTGQPELATTRWSAAAAAHGSRIALISEAGRGFTYRELEEATVALAAAFRSAGWGRGDRVAALLPNSVSLVQCYLAAARSGIVLMPLSGRATAFEVSRQLADLPPKAVIYDSEREAFVGEVVASLDRSDGISLLPHSDLEAFIDPPNGEVGKDIAGDPQSEPQDPYLVMYSGGTTGKPKAIVQTHEAWAACIDNVVDEWGLTDQDVHLIVFPMSFVAWFTCAALLAAGGTCVVWREWDPGRVLEAAERLKVTTLNMAPTMLGDVLAELEIQDRDLSHLRLLTVPGAVLSGELYKRARSRFGDILGNVYGMTETAGPITFLLPDEMRNRPSSVGLPGAGVKLKLRDDSGKDVSDAGPGEVWLAGPQISKSPADGTPESTEGGGFLRTGDVATRDSDGFLYLVGRKKEMIKSGGFNVYPREVEEVILRHPDVEQVAVFGVPHERWVESVAAAIVVVDGREVGATEIIEYCRDFLAGYKIPRIIRTTDALPRTAVGKVNKLVLRETFDSSALEEKSVKPNLGAKPAR